MVRTIDEEGKVTAEMLEKKIEYLEAQIVKTLERSDKYKMNNQLQNLKMINSKLNDLDEIEEAI